MARTGQRRLAREGRNLTQYCIDAYLVDEVLDSLPATASIVGCSINIGHPYSKFKKAVPNKLKRLGVTSLREHKPALDATLTFDETTKTAIKRNVRTACKEINSTVDKAFVKYITLRVGRNTGKFVHTTKDRLVDEADLRKKARVLGLEDVEGDANALIRALSAKKFTCQIQTQEVRTIMCTTS